MIVATPPPARVQIVAREFSLAPSRRTLRAGTAIVVLANFREDPHDLRLQRVGGTTVRGVPVQQSGRFADVTVKLLPGTYRLWCSLADHRARGMRTTLVVVRR